MTNQRKSKTNNNNKITKYIRQKHTEETKT